MRDWMMFGCLSFCGDLGRTSVMPACYVHNFAHRGDETHQPGKLAVHSQFATNSFCAAEAWKSPSAAT